MIAKTLSMLGHFIAPTASYSGPKANISTILIELPTLTVSTVSSTTTELFENSSFQIYPQPYFTTRAYNKDLESVIGTSTTQPRTIAILEPEQLQRIRRHDNNRANQKVFL